MLKRLLLPCVLMLSLGLAACGTTGSTIGGSAGGVTIGGTTVTPEKVNQVVTQVQTVSKQVCSYVPTAQSVARILSALGVGYVSAAADVAGQICAAVTTAPLADGPGDHKPRVAGVIVRGKFVR